MLDANRILSGGSESRFRDLFAFAPVGFSCNDLETGRFLEANTAMLTATGYSLEELLGLTYWDLTPEGYLPQEQEMLQRLGNAGSYGPYEKEYVAKGGKLFPVRLSGVLVVTETGRKVIWSIVEDISLQKAQARLLEAQSDELEQFFNCSLDLLCIADVNGRFLRLNPEWEQLLGYPPGALDGKAFLDYVHPEDVEKTIAAVATLAEGQRVTSFVNRYRHVDGSYRWIEWRSLPIGNKIYAAARDITAHKTAQQLVEESERRFIEIMEGALGGYWDWDLVNQTEYLSPNFKKMFGYADEEMPNLPESWQKIIYAEDLPKVMASFERHVASGGREPFYNELRYRHKNGSTVWVICAGKVVDWDGEGKPLRMVGCHVDITRQKLAEAALQASEQRFQQMLQSVDAVAVQGYGMDGRVRYWNHGAALMYGYTEEEAMGRTLYELIIPGEMQAQVQAEISNMLKTREPIPPGVLGLRRKDGSIITVYSAHTLVEIPGRAPEMFCIDVDLSERVLMEEELRSALQAAHGANQAKSEFLANMSHEIRTPLNGIIGMNELLLMNDLDAESRSYAEIIRESGQTLLQLINDILDFSKIQSGKLQLTHAPFQLQDLVWDCSRIHAAKASEQKVNLAVRVDPALPSTVLGDALRIRQVLNNLLSNAVKFTHAGEILLRLEGQGFAQNGRQVRLRFSVADSGIGIPAEAVDRLFDRFTQVDGSSTRKYGGTGLGLAICKQLVEKMGGEISVESTPGKGAVFSFSLSLGVAETEISGSAETSALPVTSLETPPPGTRMRVLIAEDNLMNQKVIVQMLQKLQFEPVAVPHGRAAVERLRQEPFPLVLMDVQMPEMDGLTATRMIREEEKRASQPHPTIIIGLTANAMAGDRERCLAAGMDDYLAKPLEMNQLRQTLQRRLGKSAPGRLN